MKQSINSKYIIDNSFFRTEPNASDLKQLNENFESGEPCFTYVTKEGNVFVYNKYLLLILTKKFEAKNKFTKVIEVVNGHSFFNDYKSGFFEGIKYFNEKYKVTPDVLFGVNSNKYERNLHYLYHHSEINSFDDGWKKYLGFNLGMLNSEYINKIGFYSGLIHCVYQLKVDYFEVFKGFNNCNLKNLVTPDSKQVFTLRTEYIEQFYSCLHDYFTDEHKLLFKAILENGNSSNQPLIFKGQANQLLDCFKKLIENNIIINCTKSELQKWIAENFRFFYRKEIKEFIPDTLEKGISRDDNPCKHPIIKISDGKICLLQS